MKKTTLLASMGIFATLAGGVQASAATNSWGNFHKTNQYFTVTNKNYKIYSDKSWHSSKNTAQYEKKTLKVKGYYDHQNGSRYLSLYNNKDKWVGYVNWKSGKTGTSPWGAKLKGSKPIATTHGNYSIYRNKDWSKCATGSDYKGKTVRVDGYYRHFNGNTYYSMKYKDKWIGYMNSKGSYNKKTNNVYQFALDRANAVAKKFGGRVISSYRPGDLDVYGTGHGNGLAVDISFGEAKKVNDAVWKKNKMVQDYIVKNYPGSTEYTITDNAVKGDKRGWNPTNYMAAIGMKCTSDRDIFKDPTNGHVNHICWHFEKPQDVFDF